ncbi:unnamed protein product [Didymodactylos carnosus]|uniref:Uncharacterized protein n=1 Tax=Didymodactylos carnosus TaxID=1234261 RepID=A0A814RIL4_9BILA|nr:unnamed protein product [Didymodactylos carnosus]CAF1134568.1 unnamed protein product [Didymodactylos carnosus]CAF3505454.1 unnamed protein product [Didymodactylos carnosus]CAF3898312.1 unnamed protein product [Didymodactylos carnosus]
MKTPQVLPNLWIVELEMPEFIQNEADGDDVVITKQEWIKQIFDVDGNKHKKMTASDVNTLKQRYDYINRMLTKKDAISISFIPDSLKKDRQDLDIWKLLNDSRAQEYQQSVLHTENNCYQQVRNGGKVLPSAAHGHSIRPEEFAKLIMELVDLINSSHMPNTDSILERYLRTRFMQEVVAEQIQLFKNELYLYVLNVICPVIYDLKRLETEQERMQLNDELNRERKRLTKFYINTMIQLAKSKIFFCTTDVSTGAASDDTRQLPKSIQDELDATECCMHEFVDPEELLEERRHILKLVEARRLEEEAQPMQKIAEAEKKRQKELADRERERVK